MENEPLIEPSPFLEIRDPELSVQEIIQEIESKIVLPPPSSLEWERISKMEFQPESPEGFRKFDPAGTAFLFEKGISPPKFTNPKLWFIKGPFKFLLTRIIEFYGLVDKKLSENRIKAFFSVLHELIRLTKRIQKIEIRLEKFYSTYLLKKDISPDYQNIDFGWSTFQYFDMPGKLNLWDNAIADLKSKNQVTVLLPTWGYILKELTIANIRFEAFSNIEEEVNFIKSKISSHISKVNSLFPLRSFLPPNSDVLIFIPLNRFPSFLLNQLFIELSSGMTKGHDVYFSMQSDHAADSSPFQDIEVTKVDVKKLPAYLEPLGFARERNLTHQETMKILRYTKIN